MKNFIPILLTTDHVKWIGKTTDNNPKYFLKINGKEDYLKFKVNNINGVPYYYEILNKLKFSKLFNKNLKYITQAGRPI